MQYVHLVSKRRNAIKCDDIIALIMNITDAVLSSVMSDQTKYLELTALALRYSSLCSGSRSASSSTRTSFTNTKSSSSGVKTMVENTPVVAKPTKSGNPTMSGIPTYPVTADNVSQYKATRAVVRPLSDNTRKIYLTTSVVGKKYKYCASSSCVRCDLIYDQVHLTKCNHGSGKQCNDAGLYPHLGRSAWRKLHAMPLREAYVEIPAMICYARHYLNPRSGEINNMEPDPKLVAMEDQPIDPPAVSTPVPRITRSAKKKQLANEKALAALKASLDEQLFAGYEMPCQNKRPAPSSFSSRSDGPARPSELTSMYRLPLDTDRILCNCGSEILKSVKNGSYVMNCSANKPNNPCPKWRDMCG